jgi:hypothetical protein
MLNNRINLSGNVQRISAVTALTIAGLLTTTLPSLAFRDSDRNVNDAYKSNDYRVCATRLLKAGVTSSMTAQSCASAIRPSEFSACVDRIKQDRKIQITPEDAVYSCGKSRRPEDLAVCVVSISKNTQRTIDPAALAYCSRSLLPVTFAQCVVGLRKTIDLTPTQSLDTCINTGDRVNNIGTGVTIPPSLIRNF